MQSGLSEKIRNMRDIEINKEVTSLGVHQLFENEMDKISKFFTGWDETLIWSCLQGYMGTAWVDDTVNPKSAQIIIADFCFLAGEANEELISNNLCERRSDFIIMVPQNEKWSDLLEQVYKENATKVTRFAVKKETEVFDKRKLEAIVQKLSGAYEIRIINQEIFDMLQDSKWAYDLVSQFKDYEEYQKRGLGVVVLHQGEPVSGASSYTVYRDGIEIEIDTKKEYRRKGLALVCGAKLILMCLQRNLYPSWDAQNKGSLELAKKLGYHFDKEYTAYEVIGFGKVITDKDIQ